MREITRPGRRRQRLRRERGETLPKVTHSSPRHQLLVHIDYGQPLGNVLEIRYSYPFVRPPHGLGEQLIRVKPEDIPTQVAEDLRFLIGGLTSRIPRPEVGRLPHVVITPTVEPAILTVVLQDSTRDLPVMRLYWYEAVKPLGTRAEFEARIDGPAQASTQELLAWHRLRRSVRAIAWADYARKVGLR